MTEDREIEERLRRYRPAGPPPELRQNVIGRVRLQADREPNRRGAWWQLAAAAALVVAALLLQSATARIDRRIAQLIEPARAADEKRLDDLTRELGGDPVARAIAEAMLVRERAIERTDLSGMEIQQ
jgi:hypothetical protein